MNPMERLLLDDMHRLLDRVAALGPEGLGDALAAHPQLRSLIDAAEARLTAVRSDLIDAYRQWEETVEEYEDLWAVCALRGAGGERAMDRRAA